MARIGVMLTVFFLCVISVSTVMAQNPPALRVSDIQLPSLRWGTQKAVFDVTNTTDVTRYLGVVTDVSFAESYLAPKRTQKTFFALGPQETRTLNPSFYIPGNYGVASIKVALYDVVDTSDVILPGAKFLEQPFTIRYSIPGQIASYFSEKITLPPMVDRHPDFDNEFARVLLYLLKEGKTVEQVAEMAMADVSFVNEVLDDMVKKGYVKKEETGYRATFPVIDVKEAEKVKSLAEAASGSLAALIKKNLPAYRKVLDSLIAADAVSADSNYFFDGGTVLGRPYPVIAALLLWYDLGTKFITRTSALTVFEQTDICNAHITSFMYAVRGGDVFNGTCFYYQNATQRTFRICYSDKAPQLECEEGFREKAATGMKAEWNYRIDDLPEDFMLDTVVIKPALASLDRGVDSTMTETYYSLKKVAAEFGHDAAHLGYRYWFWNLVATRTLDKVAAAQTVARRGKGQFRFTGIQK